MASQPSCPSSAAWSSIIEARAAQEVEVVSWLVLKRQAPNLAIGLADHDDLGCDDGCDLELLGEFFIVPDLAVGGFEGLSVLPVGRAVVVHCFSFRVEGPVVSLESAKSLRQYSSGRRRVVAARLPRSSSASVITQS